MDMLPATTVGPDEANDGVFRVGRLEWPDIVVIVLFFVIILSFGIWVSPLLLLLLLLFHVFFLPMFVSEIQGAVHHHTTRP